ncbi:hypothetical protein [Desulfocurvibacter africanus]|uniref:Glycosyl transferase, group 2 family protein n=1 Tax=Desulfocurvibacter africanus subsp. africanus str. Walvis Bay TaxID=690850 RepID=F3Z1A6_DESAF|nr:hypothetical protein [Desulfocurvibacter africanus]EGJ51109.1 glycosyl transferase, group 2 family protein [Desulfocurvibacter africanus subsp. africanus str. Walvis Bay]
MDILFSVITPSRVDRPLALAHAVSSVEAAALEAERLNLLHREQVEHLVGFDGQGGTRPKTLLPASFIDFPRQGNFGNHIRHHLLRAARGRHVLFVDDDNALLPGAFAAYHPHLQNEFIVARVDTSLAFDIPHLPRPDETGSAEAALRQGNIDPLCLCLSRDLVVARCRGWNSEGAYESDFLNFRRYFRRARSAVRIDDVVGVYDAGRGLDVQGLNERQRKLVSPATQ